MRSLVVEDEFTSRRILQRVLAGYGECHIAVDGREAREAIATALAAGEPYQLVCLDLMLPDGDGHEVLAALRAAEQERGIAPGRGARIIMTTSLGTADHVMAAFREGCDAYLRKPVEPDRLRDELTKLRLIAPRRTGATVAP